MSAIQRLLDLWFSLKHLCCGNEVIEMNRRKVGIFGLFVTSWVSAVSL